MIELSICIVNWNGKEYITKCLDSMNEYKEDLNIEIIIVDNNSSDGSVKLIEKKFPDIKLIKNESNIGFARACNQAILKSTGRFILILNPDIIIVENCFKTMIDILTKTENAGCVSCKLMNPDGNLQENHFNFFPNSYNEFFREGLFFDRFLKKNPKREISNSPVTKLKWATGACLLFYRDVLMKLNGFDQQFFMYSEDVDICYRLIKLGYSLYGINNVKMFHYLGAISEKKENKFFSVIMQKESRYRYIIKHSGKIHACLYRFLWLLAGFLRSTLAFIIFLLVMFYKSKELGIKRILIKHLKIVSWALYLESWVNPLYDDGR